MANRIRDLPAWERMWRGGASAFNLAAGEFQYWFVRSGPQGIETRWVTEKKEAIGLLRARALAKEAYVG